MYGQYLCCGQVPLFGSHNFHRYGGRVDLPGYGHYCPICHESASALGSAGWEFYTRIWNDKLHTDPLNPPPVNAPAGYHYATLDATAYFLGTTIRIGSNGILFKTSSDFEKLLVASSRTIIEKNANLPDLEVMSLDGKHHHVFDLTKKRGIHAIIRTNRTLHYDKGTTITLDITTLQNRTGWDLRNFCEKLGLEEN